MWYESKGCFRKLASPKQNYRSKGNTWLTSQIVRQKVAFVGAAVVLTKSCNGGAGENSLSRLSHSADGSLCFPASVFARSHRV